MGDPDLCLFYLAFGSDRKVCGQIGFCGPTITSSWLRFEMEKKNRCSHCEGRLDPSSDSQSCKTCTLKYSSEASYPSTSEVKREQVRGKAVSDLLQPGPRNDLRVQQIICFMLLLYKWEEYFFLTSEYDSRQNSFEGILSLRCQASPLKNESGLFSIFILFYLFPLFTSQIWEKYVLSTIPKHGKGKECSFVRYLRRIIAQFEICDGIKISFFLISVSFLPGEPNFTFLFSISVSKGK